MSGTPKSLLLLLVFISFVLSGFGQTPTPSTWPPSSEHTTAPLWSGGAPGASTAKAAEQDTTTAKDRQVAGRPVIRIGNVSVPTLTLYGVKSAPNSGPTPAVVVFPGGGYYVLAIDLEGTEVCDWLTSEGITCVLLKYRVPHTGPQWDDRCKCEMNPKAPMARSLS